MKLKKLIPAILSAVMILSYIPLKSFSQSIEGDWHGVADIQGMQLRLSVHVKSAAEGYTSTWDSPDQNAFEIPSTTTTFSFPEFSFSHEQAGLKYVGKVNPDYTEIVGFLEQGKLKTGGLYNHARRGQTVHIRLHSQKLHVTTTCSSQQNTVQY